MEHDKPLWTFVPEQSSEEKKKLKRKLIHTKKYQYVEFQFKLHDQTEKQKRPRKKSKVDSVSSSTENSPTMHPTLQNQEPTIHQQQQPQTLSNCTTSTTTTVAQDAFLTPQEFEQILAQPSLETQTVHPLPMDYNQNLYFLEVTNWLKSSNDELWKGLL